MDVVWVVIPSVVIIILVIFDVVRISHMDARFREIERAIRQHGLVCSCDIAECDRDPDCNAHIG